MAPTLKRGAVAYFVASGAWSGLTGRVSFRSHALVLYAGYILLVPLPEPVSLPLRTSLYVMKSENSNKGCFKLFLLITLVGGLMGLALIGATMLIGPFLDELQIGMYIFIALWVVSGLVVFFIGELKKK